MNQTNNRIIEECSVDYNLSPQITEVEEKCTCGEPHISKMIEHCYNGKPCFVKPLELKLEGCPAGIKLHNERIS